VSRDADALGILAGPQARAAEELVMTQVYGTLRVAPGDEGVLSVVIDTPPMNLIGPELVRDLVSLLGELEYFVPHVDLTKVAEYRPARPPCSRRACRPVARSNSTSATASEPCNKHRAACVKRPTPHQ
jgi:hypothetical protein